MEKKVSRLSQRQYITLQEAADIYGCSVRTIRRMITDGELTGYRIGAQMLRVLHTEVMDLITPIPAGR